MIKSRQIFGEHFSLLLLKVIFSVITAPQASRDDAEEVTSILANTARQVRCVSSKFYNTGDELR